MRTSRFWVVLAMVCLMPAAAEAAPRRLSPQAFREVRQLAVQHNGRVKPFDSFCWEVLDRVTGSARYQGQEPVETILSIMAEPDRWQETPVVSVPFRPLRENLGLGPKEGYISYGRLVSEKKLMRMLPAIVEKQQRDEKLSMLENETMDGYDRFVVLTELFQGKIHLVPPARGNVWETIGEAEGLSRERRAEIQQRWEDLLTAFREDRPAAVEEAASALAAELRAVNPEACPAPWRLRLEVLYNDLASFKVARVLYVLGAFLLLWFALGGKRALAGRAGMVLLAAAFLLHGAGIVTRVVLGERPPVSNFYETMLWLPFVGMILAFVFERVYRSGMFGFAGGFLAGAFLLLADHLPLDPSISPVVAVLRSNLWLTIHVLTIVGSYAPIALAAVLAHVYGVLYLARGPKHPALDSVGMFLYRSLQVGIVMLASGIMLGAVWANASWGRYWGWDPKETWALITLLWLLAVFHGRFAGWLSGVAVALSTICGFFLVLMTYYGVSFYLVGLHSYAGGNAKPFPPLLTAYLVAEVVFMAAVSWAALSQRRVY